jgi:hypothetical protein
MRINSLQEALAAVDYLQRRGLLCGKCGWHLATGVSQFGSECELHKVKNRSYDPAKPANIFEKALCDAVHAWMESQVPGEE